MLSYLQQWTENIFYQIPNVLDSRILECENNTMYTLISIKSDTHFDDALKHYTTHVLQFNC